MEETNRRVPIDAQQVDAPLSQFAVFLTVTIRPDPADLATAREVVAALDDLAKTVGFRDLGANLSCVVGIGSAAWDRLGRAARPSELRQFVAITAGGHTAPSTPGDLLFHIRADRADLCFEFERLLLEQLGDAVAVVDEVQGFRYFDARDLLGFVDGTANPSGAGMAEATLIGDEDSGVRGRQLRGRAEVPARPRGVERDDHRGAGGRHRPPQGRQRRARRHRAAAGAQDARHDHRRRRERARDPARQHAVREPGRRASSAPTSSATRAASG